MVVVTISAIVYDIAPLQDKLGTGFVQYESLIITLCGGFLMMRFY